MFIFKKLFMKESDTIISHLSESVFSFQFVISLVTHPSLVFFQD